MRYEVSYFGMSYLKLMKSTGMCRQFIREFADLDTPIFMYDKDGEYVVMTLEQV